jgi:hypothetical protein
MRQGKTRRIPVLALTISMALTGCASPRAGIHASALFEREDSLVKQGETFVGIDGGACLGRCPSFEILVFDTGRVLFRGREYTRTTGLVESRIEPAAFAELTRVLDERRAFGWRMRLGCVTDHPSFQVYSARGSRTRVAALNSGCSGERDDAAAIVDAFIRISRSEAHIGD